jgi:hypothetical protein
MVFLDGPMVERVMKERRREALETAERYRLLCRSGLHRQGWLSRQVCRLLCWVGRLLVETGQRLERYGLPATGSVDTLATKRAFSGGGG